MILKFQKNKPKPEQKPKEQEKERKDKPAEPKKGWRGKKFRYGLSVD